MTCKYCGAINHPRRRWGNTPATCGRKYCQRLRKTEKQRERREQGRGAKLIQLVEATQDPILRRIVKQHGRELLRILRPLRSVSHQSTEATNKSPLPSGRMPPYMLGQKP